MENDLISRSELLGKFMAMLTFSSDRVVLIESVIEQIQNAPTVPQVTVFAENASKEEIENFKQELEKVMERPQGEWIKTSEKNPKRSGFYITTCEDICCRNIRVCGYDAVQKKWSRGGVVAWMPNPEPYEE